MQIQPYTFSGGSRVQGQPHFFLIGQMDTPQSNARLQIPQNPLAKKYDMKHVKYCLLGAQAFPLELVDDLVRAFPNCTLGQVYGKSRDALW